MAVSEDLGPRRIPPVAGLNLGPAGCAGRIAGPGGQALQPGETLFAEGDEADSAYEVACGLLRLCRMLPDGRRQIIGFLSEGGILGLPPDGIRCFTVEAATRAVVRPYRRAVFERRIAGEPSFARRLLDAAYADLRQAQEQVLLLGRKSALEKVASFLLQMARLQGDGDEIILPVRRGDIADYLGLSIETVSRSLTRLRLARVIALHTPEEVAILDRDRLEDCAAGAA